MTRRRSFRFVSFFLVPLSLGILAGCAADEAAQKQAEPSAASEPQAAATAMPQDQPQVDGISEMPSQADADEEAESSPDDAKRVVKRAPSPAEAWSSRAPAASAMASAAPPPRRRPASKSPPRTGTGEGYGPGHGFGGRGEKDKKLRFNRPGGKVDLNGLWYDQGLLADGQMPADMFFRHYGVNPTVDTEEEPRSTFAVDVDTASYTMTRSYLERGMLPAEGAVRVEEVVNAFDYGYEPPRDETFSIHAEAAPSPNRRGYHILHIGVKGKEVSAGARKPVNLVFVIDVSGSMDADNRLGLVKRSLRLLVNQLAETDKVGIVTFGSTAREVLQPTSAHRRADILRVIDSLSTEGATNAEAGLRAGYQMAERNLRKGAVNRVVLCSDGVANVGITGPQGILATVERQVKRGITISTIGVGMGNYNDVLMEQLADKGDGNYHYVDRLAEARRVFVDQLTGTLQTIAKDVKIQVAFDPQVVSRYRLIGYENRGLKSREFNDDRVDAGEIGAGHSVTALYEVRVRPGSHGPLGTIRVRYKRPSGGASALIETSISRSVVRSATDGLSSPSQLSLAAAQFAEKLRGSYWARNVSYDDILRRFDMVSETLRQRADVVELRSLVEKARSLDQRGDKFAGHGPIAMMDFDRVPILR